jgi:hypothetical protein
MTEWSAQRGNPQLPGTVQAGMKLSLVMGPLIAASVLAAGCGAQPAGKRPAAIVTCVTPRPGGPGRSFTIDGRDNGKSFCVRAGTGIFVFLHGKPATMWSPILSSSGAVQRRPSGVMSLALGVTGAYFVASGHGRATLSSHRGAAFFHVLVLIRGGR